MPNHKSDQFTQLSATPRELVPARDAHGTRRVAFASFTTPAGGVAIDDTVQLLKLPPGARLHGGKLVCEAMSSGGAAASLRLGDGTTSDKYLGDTSIDAAAQVSFAHTIALGYGTALAAEVVLTATVKTEALAADKKLYVEVEYALD